MPVTKGKDHYKREIVEACPVDLYAPLHTVMNDYPHRLGNPGRGCSSPTLAAKSDYILDSRITDPEITNRDVLSRAEDLDADYIVPADTLTDRAATTGAVSQFMEMLPEYDTDAEVIIPLQHDSEEVDMGTDYDRDHIEHYQNLAEVLEDHGRDIEEHKVAIGGVVHWSNTHQLEVAVDLREYCGTTQDIHGLGIGFDWHWMTVIRKVPWLFNSIDNSRSGNQIRNGKILTPEMDVMTYKNPRGKNSTVLSAMLTEHSLYMANYLMTEYCKPEDAPNDLSILPEDMRQLVVKHIEWRQVEA